MRRKSYDKLAKKLKSPPEGKIETIKKELEFLSKKDEETKELRKAHRQLRKMSNEQLEMLSDSKDNFILDCFLDQVPTIVKLEHDREDLKNNVIDLANFNYAREPELVRDRLKLREILCDTDTVKRRISSKQQTIMEKLGKIQNKLTDKAREHEEKSEVLAKDFLDSKIDCYEDLKSQIDKYIDIRKAAIKKRTLADKFAKDLAALTKNFPKMMDQNSPNLSSRRFNTTA